MKNEILSKDGKKEKKRLKALLIDCNISEKRITALESVIENVSWMKVKLDEARQAIGDAPVAVPYDNGGGQKGIRENPLFKGYESLWKSYIAGMDRILSCLPSENAEIIVEEAENPATILDEIRKKSRG